MQFSFNHTFDWSEFCIRLPTCNISFAHMFFLIYICQHKWIATSCRFDFQHNHLFKTALNVLQFMQMRFCCFNLQLRNKLKSMFLLLRTARLKHLPFLLCILPLSFYLSICHLFSIFLYRQSLSIFVLYSLENTCEIRISAPFIVYFEFIFRSRSPFFISHFR